MLDWVILSRGLTTVRASIRAFVRTPGLSIALLLTIAIGVGSNASVYGFVQGLTNPGIWLRHADRIVSILGQDRFHELGQLSRVEYLQLKQRSNLFGWIGAARIEPTDIAIDGHAKIVIVAAVTLQSSEGAKPAIRSRDHCWPPHVAKRIGQQGRYYWSPDSDR